MVENAFGDFFMSDSDDDLFEDDDEIIAPVVVPVTSPASAAGAATSSPAPAGPVPVGQHSIEASAGNAPDVVPGQAAVAAVQAPATAPAAAMSDAAPMAAATQAPPSGGSREERLAAALNRLMNDSHEIQASALVSLDGFTMASALPEGMQEDRVGAMSAAILGLGERAAVELGRGSLSQVIIEGDGGYVVLISAGPRAALTSLADTDAKLGLVLYDMRTAADAIAEILG